MFPTVVLDAEGDLDEGTPFGALGFADEMHAGFLRGAVGFAGVARDARANDVFPSGGAAAIARDNVVEIEVLALEKLSAVLTCIAVALENVVAGEFDFLAREAVEHEEQNDAGDADFEGDGGDGFRVGFLLGKIAPLAEAEGLENSGVIAQDHLGVPLEEEGEGAAGRADIDRLPEAVEHQHMLIQVGTHTVTGGR
jgi:hypothetical protein